MEEEQKIPIINIMEEIVDQRADAMIDRTDMCRCQQCRADVKTHALNHLPPKYVASISGGVFTHTQSTRMQMQAEIMIAIMNAVSLVSKNPKHPMEDVLKKGPERRLTTRSAKVEQAVREQSRQQGTGEAGVSEAGPKAAPAPEAAKQAAPQSHAAGTAAQADTGAKAADAEAKMAAALAAARARAAQETGNEEKPPQPDSPADSGARQPVRPVGAGTGQADGADDMIESGPYGAFDGTEPPAL
jgi:competence protein ComFB